MAQREGLPDEAWGNGFPSDSIVQRRPWRLELAGPQLPLRGRHSNEPNLLPPAEMNADKKKNGVSGVPGVDPLGLGLC